MAKPTSANFTVLVFSCFSKKTEQRKNMEEQAPFWAPKGGTPKGGAPKGAAPTWKNGARRVGPEGWPLMGGAPKGGARTQKKRWGPEGWGPEGWEAQNFALFFLLSRLHFALLVSLWGVFSWNFGGV